MGFIVPYSLTHRTWRRLPYFKSGFEISSVPADEEKRDATCIRSPHFRRIWFAAVKIYKSGKIKAEIRMRILNEQDGAFYTVRIWTNTSFWHKRQPRVSYDFPFRCIIQYKHIHFRENIVQPDNNFFILFFLSTVLFLPQREREKKLRDKI